MRKLFTLLTMALLAAFASYAAVETVTFSEQGYTNAEAVSSYTGTNFSIAFTDGGTATAYYNTGEAVRVYAGGSMTVSSSDLITSIVLTFGTGDYTNEITVDKGTYTDGSWTGSANSVTFSVGGTTKHRRIASVTVTTSGESGLAAPVITATGTAQNNAGEWIGSAEVTISAAEGATIYYTTDGGDPGASDALYASSFTVTETTTVKAIAYSGDKTSAVTTLVVEIGEADPPASGNVEVIELTADAQGFENQQKVSSVSGSVVTLTFSKGTGATDPAYYTTGDAVRVYNGGTMTISAGGRTITKVVFEYELNGTATVSVSPETYDASTMTWTGSATEVVLTAGTAKHVRIKKVTVTYEGEGTVIAAPVISPASQEFENDLTVTITAAEGTIYYTTDGTNPTTASTEYTAPFVVSGQTTTVKAIAVDVTGASSAVASATYTYTGAVTLSLPVSLDFTTAADFNMFELDDQTLPEGLTHVWVRASSYGAKASGYVNNNNTASEGWFISPLIDLTSAQNPTLTFSQALNKFAAVDNFATEATLWVKTENGQWQQVTITYPASQSWNFSDCTVSLANFKGNKVKVAFKYVSTTSSAGTWEIKTFNLVDGEFVKTYTDATIAESNTWTSSKDDINLQLENAEVIFVGGDYICLRQEFNGQPEATCLYQTGFALTKNQVLNGDLKLNFTRYHQMPEFKKINDNESTLADLTIDEGSDVEPTEVTVDEIAALQHKWDLVKLTEVEFVENDGTYYIETAATGTAPDSVQVFDKLQTGLMANLDITKKYDFVALFGDYYHSKAQLFPVSIVEHSDAVAGDLDGNGLLEVNDVVILAGLAMGGGATAEQLLIGDLDGSGSIDVNDVVILAGRVMGS